MVYQMIMQIDYYQEYYIATSRGFALEVDIGRNLGIPLGTILTLGTLLGRSIGAKDGTQSQII